MEGLLIILFELVSILFYCIFGIVFTPILGILDAICVFSPSKSEYKISALFKNKFFLKFLKFTSYIFSFIFIILLVFNFFFFSKSLKFISEKISSKTKTAISFQNSEGNLFTGNIILNDINLSKLENGKSNFDIKIGSLKLKAPLWGVFSSSFKVEYIQINGLHGNVVLIEFIDEKSKTKKLKSKKKFIVENFNIEKSSLNIKKENAPDLNVQIDNFEITPFRSNYAIFDLIFRNNLTAVINQIPVNIRTNAIDNGRETIWSFTNLPVNILSQYINKTPFNMFESGSLDLIIKDKWQLGKNPVIDLDWDMNFKSITMKSEKTNGFLQKSILSKISNYFDIDRNISFKFSIEEEKWKGKASLDAAELWNDMSKAFIQKLFNQNNSENSLKTKLKGAMKIEN